MSSFGSAGLVPKLFLMGASDAGVAISDQESYKSLCIVYPLVNESALAGTIVTQLIHMLEWLR